MRNIEVIDYKQSWSQDFENEKLQIEEAVGSLSPAIHHIGSTSVKNLAAKPIIDMLVEVDALEDLELFNENLEEIGYIAKGENGITGRRYYEKGGDDRSHQIHAFVRNSKHCDLNRSMQHHEKLAVEWYALTGELVLCQVY